jgi:hypothetical protein
MGCADCKDQPTMALLCPHACSNSFDYKKEREPEQPEPTIPENACGPKYGNKKCPGSQCCSKDGQCGFDKEHCGKGCQSEFGYYCLPSDYENTMCIQCMGCADCENKPGMALLCPHACSNSFDYKKEREQEQPEVKEPEPKPEPEPTIPENACGPKYGDKKCPDNQCCNADGQCGFDREHCGNGCQSEFGYCLPENYRNIMCIACYGCVDCGNDPVSALVCPSTCKENTVKKPVITVTKTSIIRPKPTGKPHPIDDNKPKNRCGPKYGNKKCPGDECCNSKGQCGFDRNYCGKGCQSEFGYCLPKGFEHAMCIQCVGCVDCSKNPYMALVCPGTCRKLEAY